MDAIALLSQDHREAEKLFNDFIDTPDAQTRKHIVDFAGRALGVHAAIEEMHFYPAIRNRIEDGDHLVHESIEEHKTMKQALAMLERLGVGDFDFERMVLELVAGTKHHIADEESRVFPKVKEAFSPEELEELGKTLEAAKQIAPTHAHPKGPSSGIGAKIADPVAGVLDHARDALGRRPTEEQVKEEIREHAPETYRREPHT